MLTIGQGDVIQVEGIKYKLLVVSNDVFNKSDNVLVCPFDKNVEEGALHIPLDTENDYGFIVCEDIKRLDLNIRGYKKIESLSYKDIFEVTDAIQSIFEF